MEFNLITGLNVSCQDEEEQEPMCVVWTSSNLCTRCRIPHGVNTSFFESRRDGGKENIRSQKLKVEYRWEVYYKEVDKGWADPIAKDLTVDSVGGSSIVRCTEVWVVASRDTAQLYYSSHPQLRNWTRCYRAIPHDILVHHLENTLLLLPGTSWSNMVNLRKEVGPSNAGGDSSPRGKRKRHGTTLYTGAFNPSSFAPYSPGEIKRALEEHLEEEKGFLCRQAIILLTVRRAEISERLHASMSVRPIVDVEALDKCLAQKVGSETGFLKFSLLQQVALLAERAMEEAGTLVMELVPDNADNRELCAANKALIDKLIEVEA
uniref:Uncharacterized protein n=1 Tax=Cannabis sativa TaxID=3483 RepID=A0A803PKH3_CANSA